MAIDKIKELIHFQNWPNVTELTIEQKTIITIADYLIQEHEQKEDDFVIEHKPKVSIPVTITIDTPVVEVGQIWRNKEDGELCKVCSLDDEIKENIVPYVVFSEDSELAGSIMGFYVLYELVTMQNIKPGEWAYDPDYDQYAQVKTNENGEITFTDGTQPVVEKWFPCLPPTETEEKEEPLYKQDERKMYTHKEVMEIADKHFVEGRISMEKCIKEVQGIRYTQEDLDRTAIQEFNKGKAVGYEEGYKSAENDFKKMLEVHGYLK